MSWLDEFENDFHVGHPLIAYSKKRADEAKGKRAEARRRTHAATRNAAARNGSLSSGNRGNRSNHPTKLSDDDVRAVRAMSREGATGRDIARRFGVAHSTISNILTGRARRNVE